MKKIAVIGLGNIATRHRENLKKLFPKAKVIAMPSRERQCETTIAHADSLVKNINELITLDIDFAIIASPATLHIKHATPLLEAGIPVLIEKPLAASLPEADKLLKQIKQSNTPACVAYCLRYLSSSRHVKSILSEGLLGRLYSTHIETGQYLPNWRPNLNYRSSVSAQRALGGGVLLELSHELDLAYWLFGKMSVEHAILRYGPELELDVEDCVDATLRTQDNNVIQLHLDFLQQAAHRIWRFIGTQATLEWDLVKNQIRLIKSNSSEIIYDAPNWDKNHMYLHMIQDFVALIEERSHQTISVSDAYASLALIQDLKSRFPLIPKMDYC